MSAFDYTSRDFNSLLSDLQRRIMAEIPEWTGFNQGFEKILIENYAYVGDILNFYIDRMANEAYVQTAVLRESLLNLAQMFGYVPSPQTASSCTVQFTKLSSLLEDVVIPVGTQVYAQTEGQAPLLFETVFVAGRTDGATVLLSGNTTVTVTAKEGTSVTSEVIGVSNGAAKQTMALFTGHVIKDSVRVFTQDGPLDPLTGNPSNVEWTFFERLIDAQFYDRAFTTFTDESGYTSVVFGDDVSGRIPAVNVNVTANYRYGVGSAGNVGIGAIKGLVSGGVLMSKITSVTNTTAAQGGADIESIDSMRTSIPKSLRTLNRAVTLADYSSLSLDVAGVAKANATATVSTNVTVYIAPVGGGAPVTSLSAAVNTYLTQRAMIGTTLTISPPTYVPINVTCAVTVNSRYRQDTVVSSITTALTNLFVFANRSFAENVLFANVFSACKDLLGVDYFSISVHSRTGSGMADVQLAVNEIATLGTVVITPTGGIVPA